MSCRHDLALTNCMKCYPNTGKINPGPDSEYELNLDGPGAALRAKTILVDMDSMIAEFYWRILSDYWNHTGVRLPDDFINGWDSKFPNGQSMHDYFSRPGFFRELEPVPGGLEVLKKYHDQGHEIVVASSATLTNAPGEKFEWLSEYAPWIHRDRVAFFKEKWRLQGDILLDDHHENARKFKIFNPKGKTAGILYPYNQGNRNCFDVLADGYRQFELAWIEIDAALSRWTKE